MKLDLRILVVVLCAGVSAVSASAMYGDPTTWLSQARVAIGGEVATEAVTSLRVRGSLRRNIGSIATDSSWTMSWQAPDKFVIEQVQGMDMGPLGTRSVTRRSGFNGDQLISETISDAPMPPLPPNPRPEARIVLGHQQTAARLLLALLASPTVVASYPLAPRAPQPVLFSPPGSNTTQMAGPDGEWFQLALDAQAHLPAMVSWMGRPIVTFKTTSTAVVSSRGDVVRSTPPGVLPSGDPTVGMADVEYRMALTDYRLDKGVQWPRRLTTTIGDQPYEAVRVNRYDINPAINARTFQVRR